jgi:hypothetical protein
MELTLRTTQIECGYEQDSPRIDRTGKPVEPEELYIIHLAPVVLNKKEYTELHKNLNSHAVKVTVTET